LAQPTVYLLLFDRAAFWAHVRFSFPSLFLPISLNHVLSSYNGKLRILIWAVENCDQGFEIWGERG
jgi:hypothetical protein